MLRAAIYARYSSDRQDERSIDDQIALCREHAAKLGASVIATYADYEISGASLRNRPEALHLLHDVRERRFDLVLIELLNRVARDQEDVAHLWKRVIFAGAKLISVGEGEINEMHIGLKGTMNAMQLKDLAAHTKRGQKGRIAAGKSAGGRSYGYDVVRALDAKGEPLRGERRVNADEAAIVRRIFEAFVAGESPRAIAATLNAERVPSPMGGPWNASTINGHASRGNGILWNRLYVGELVWNRVSMVKDPETGRRISRLNPREAWQVVPAPELRIVLDALWNAAQALKRGQRALPLTQQRRAKHLFSGLLSCARCGGPYVSTGATSIGCAHAKERGTCANRGATDRRDVERRILDGLRTKLLHPEAIREAIRVYHEERQRLRDARVNRERSLAKRLPQIKLEIERLVDAICAGAATPATKERLVALERDKAALEQDLAALEAGDRVVDVHPGALEGYRRMVEDLAAALGAGTRDAESVALIRGLVEKIEIRPMGRGRAPDVTLYGRLAELLTVPDPSKRSGVSLVAGDRVRRYPDAEIPLVVAC